jgi:bifunctional non-homologous end joining protein LigD
MSWRADFYRQKAAIVEALARLRSRSCIIDGEAVACDDTGVSSFDLIRHHGANHVVFLYAFDLIELNGDDLRHDPLEVRNETLAMLLAKAGPGIRFNEHMRARARSCFAMHASSASKALSRSARTRPTARGARPTGSK